TALGMALVLWTANAGRDYCSAIVVCEFCIAAVQDGIHAGIFQHTGTEIVRDRQPGYAAEILIGMYMAEQPVFRLHVTAELSINIAAAGKDPYKKVCGNSLSSNRIFDRQCPACPVHFHGISGLMMDPHRSFGFFCPCPVNVTKLCILVWDTPDIGAIDLIFFPKQCQVHSF